MTYHIGHKRTGAMRHVGMKFSGTMKHIGMKFANHAVSYVTGVPTPVLRTMEKKIMNRSGNFK